MDLHINAVSRKIRIRCANIKKWHNILNVLKCFTFQLAYTNFKVLLTCSIDSNLNKLTGFLSSSPAVSWRDSFITIKVPEVVVSAAQTSDWGIIYQGECIKL